MADSPFFHQVDSSVKSAINLRKKYYKAETRDTSALNWLYKKMAYAEVTAIGTEYKVVKASQVADPNNQLTDYQRWDIDLRVKPTQKAVVTKLTLGTRQGGGIAGGALGVYEQQKISNDVSILPKPHLNTVKISAEGDFGTIQRCDISFTCYSISQLNDHMAFLTLGNDLNITYGWNSGGQAAGPIGNFTGKICNFSYSLNAAGGFDCTANAIGMGPNTINVNANVSNAAGELTQKIDARDVSDLVTTFVSKLYNDAVLNQQKKRNFQTGAGLMAMYPSNDPTKSKAVQEVAYVTLEYIVNTVNYYILAGAWNFSTADTDKKYRITFDDTWTQPKDMKTIMPDFRTANPEILYPGFADFNPLFTPNAAANLLKFSDNTKPKNLLIRVNLIERLLAVPPEKNATGKSRDNSISGLFSRLFDEIKNATGGLVKLTIIKDPNSESMMISDPDNVSITEDKDTLMLTGVTLNGVCRTASVVTKIPSDMATAAFVTTSKKLMDQSGAAKDILGQSDARPSDAPDATKIIEQLKASQKSLISQKFTQQSIDDAVKALESYINLKQENFGGSIPYPIEFSCTLDGISGFKFGDTIKFNYLPDVYLQGANKIAFTITKVEHDISGNDWVTTLNTVCRLATSGAQ